MKKSINPLMAVLIISSSSVYTSDSATPASIVKPLSCLGAKEALLKIPTLIKQSGSYLFSVRGAKDIALTLVLRIGLITAHELGHAIMAKILHGCPIDIVIGQSETDWWNGFSEYPYFQIGGIKFVDLIPEEGRAKVPSNFFNNKNNALKNAAISIAGPICGALAGWLAYKQLKNCDYSYIAYTEIISFSLRNALSLRLLPGRDGHKFLEFLKQYKERLKDKGADKPEKENNQ